MTKFQDLSRLKAFADNNINVIQNLKYGPCKGRKTLSEKEEMLLTSIFFLFVQCCFPQGRSMFGFCGNKLSVKITFNPLPDDKF